MTISVKLLNDHIKKISETNSLLDMLLEFEKFLEDVDLYAYKNWMKGELLEGPKLSRHYISAKFLYPRKDMPDPYGAKRLHARECMVKFTEDTLIRPVRIKSYDDVTTEIKADGRVKTKAKTKSEPVWVVEIKIPRKYVDEFETDVIEADEDAFVDLEAMNKEQQEQAQPDAQAGADPMAPPPIPPAPPVAGGAI